VKGMSEVVRYGTSDEENLIAEDDIHDEDMISLGGHVECTMCRSCRPSFWWTPIYSGMTMQSDSLRLNQRYDSISAGCRRKLDG
jgi:hypothetical protein